MNRKLMTLFAALTAFVALAVVPALASASLNGTLQTHTATPIAVGTNIIGTSTNFQFTTNNNVVIQCATKTMTGKVTGNNGTKITGEITTATWSGKAGILPHGVHCESSLGNTSITAENLPWCLFAVQHVMETDTVTLDSCTAGKNIAYTTTTTPFGFSVATCTFENTDHVVASYQTNTSPLVLTLKSTTSGFKKTVGPESCGVHGDLAGSYRFTLDNSGADGTDLKITNTL